MATLNKVNQIKSKTILMMDDWEMIQKWVWYKMTFLRQELNL